MKLINVRKLAALDIHFHGARIILIEFAVGVALCAGLGIWFIVSGFNDGVLRSSLLLVFGIGLIGIAINYLSLLIYAISVTPRHSARVEVFRELANPGKYVGMYSIQSAILILIPLALSLLAVVQEIQTRTRL